MAPGTKSTWFSLVAAVCAMSAPFFAGAAALMVGIGFYRAMHEGPRGQAPSLAATWEVIAPAWPLLSVTLFLAGLGYFCLRKTRRDAQFATSE